MCVSSDRPTWWPPIGRAALSWPLHVTPRLHASVICTVASSLCSMLVSDVAVMGPLSASLCCVYVFLCLVQYIGLESGNCRQCAYLAYMNIHTISHSSQYIFCVGACAHTATCTHMHMHVFMHCHMSTHRHGHV